MKRMILLIAAMLMATNVFAGDIPKTGLQPNGSYVDAAGKKYPDTMEIHMLLLGFEDPKEIDKLPAFCERLVKELGGDRTCTYAKKAYSPAEQRNLPPIHNYGYNRLSQAEKEHGSTVITVGWKATDPKSSGKEHGSVYNSVDTVFGDSRTPGGWGFTSTAKPQFGRMYFARNWYTAPVERKPSELAAEVAELRRQKEQLEIEKLKLELKQLKKEK